MAAYIKVLPSSTETFFLAHYYTNMIQAATRRAFEVSLLYQTHGILEL